jgi:hypothetical protein
MVFKRKGFFLTFDEAAAKKPAAVAPAAPAPAEEAPEKIKKAGPAKTKPAAAVAVEAPAEVSTADTAAGERVLTTAEALAAELREALANRPAPSQATFAPANLSPGGALPIRRRSGGANLAPFRAIASGLFR